jgi:hypothetical protein
MYLISSEFTSTLISLLASNGGSVYFTSDVSVYIKIGGKSNLYLYAVCYLYCS